jgi:hypothetical protein
VQAPYHLLTSVHLGGCWVQATVLEGEQQQEAELQQAVAKLRHLLDDFASTGPQQLRSTALGKAAASSSAFDRYAVPQVYTDAALAARVGGVLDLQPAAHLCTLQLPASCGAPWCGIQV